MLAASFTDSDPTRTFDCFPTIAEDDELWALDSELGQYVFTR